MAQVYVNNLRTLQERNRLELERRAPGWWAARVRALSALCFTD